MSENYRFGRFHFQGQHENEVILQVIHRHWFNIVMHLSLVAGLSVLLLGSLFATPALFPEIVNAVTTPLLTFVENTILLAVWLYGFLVWIDYYFDVWIVTNERIVNIEQKGLFTRRISELRFSRVQDVSATVGGLIPTMLNFGDVSVQTAAEEERFLFRQVGDPFAVKDRVMTLARQANQDDMREIATALGKK